MKRLIEILPILTATLIFVSFLNMNGYYHVVDINIYNYIDTAELILSFLPFIYNYALYSCIIVLLFILILRRIDRVGESQFFDRITTKHITATIKILLIIFSVCTLSVVLAQLDIIRISYRKYAFLIAYMCIISCGLIMYIFFIPDENKEKYKYLFLFIGFIYLAGIISVLGVFKGEEIILKKGNNNLSFTSNNLEITTDSINIFYGETKNYIFIYNVKDNITSAFKKDEITNLKFKETPFPNTSISNTTTPQVDTNSLLLKKEIVDSFEESRLN